MMHLFYFFSHDVRFLPGWVDAKVLCGVDFMTDVSNFALSVKPLCHRICRDWYDAHSKNDCTSFVDYSSLTNSGGVK
jgi:hypothetical protein